LEYQSWTSMKTLLFFIALSLFRFSFDPDILGRPSNPSQNTQSISFQKRMEIVHSKVVDLTALTDLYHVPEFLEVYKNPYRYKDAVLRYLKQSDNDTNRIIAIYSMSDLSIDNYVDQLNSFYILFQKKAVSGLLLSRYIFNEFDVKQRMFKNYKNPSLRNVLNKILIDKNISLEIKANIKGLLNGKIYRDLNRVGQVH
jgi:hypothetical protein